MLHTSDGHSKSSSQCKPLFLLRSKLYAILFTHALQYSLHILLEVNIGGEAAKSGFAPQEVENAAAQAKEMDHVRVRGLMTIPPADATREENVVYFQKVQALYVDINRKMYDNELEYLSMGMSGDFADAIRAGANMVRVGTAIFGARDYSK